jgi:hypothetical protein
LVILVSEIFIFVVRVRVMEAHIAQHMPRLLISRLTAVVVKPSPENKLTA